MVNKLSSEASPANALSWFTELFLWYHITGELGPTLVLFCKLAFKV